MSVFFSSTHSRFWTFDDTETLAKLRIKANTEFKTAHSTTPNCDDFLSPEEEAILILHWEYKIKSFLSKFEPSVPLDVVGTSVQYFKRFYLKNSIMDYHPRDISLACVYLACKVEEFTISIVDFTKNVYELPDPSDDRDLLHDLIVFNELIVVEKLNFQLKVHNSYRALQGFIFDLKLRCPELKTSQLWQPAHDLVDKSLNTDVIFLFAPSLIALTAVVFAAVKFGISLDDYVVAKLFPSLREAQVIKIKASMRKIWMHILKIPVLNLNEIHHLEDKLLRCFNRNNDFRTFKNDIHECSTFSVTDEILS